MCHLRAWKEGRANLVTDTVKQLIGVSLYPSNSG
jgi:hypothetical protein